MLALTISFHYEAKVPISNILYVFPFLFKSHLGSNGYLVTFRLVFFGGLVDGDGQGWAFRSKGKEREKSRENSGFQHWVMPYGLQKECKMGLVIGFVGILGPFCGWNGEKPHLKSKKREKTRRNGNGKKETVLKNPKHQRGMDKCQASMLGNRVAKQKKEKKKTRGWGTWSWYIYGNGKPMRGLQKKK